MAYAPRGAKGVSKQMNKTQITNCPRTEFVCVEQTFRQMGLCDDINANDILMMLMISIFLLLLLRFMMMIGTTLIIKQEKQ